MASRYSSTPASSLPRAPSVAGVRPARKNRSNLEIVREPSDFDAAGAWAQFVKYFLESLESLGISAAALPGGLACYRDGMRFLDQLAQQLGCARSGTQAAVLSKSSVLTFEISR